MQCQGTNRDGTRCRLSAMYGESLCYHHEQVARADPNWIFHLPLAEVNRRAARWTRKQIEALQFVCSGESFSRRDQVLGVAGSSFQNRLVTARARAGLRTRAELIALYAIWRRSKVSAIEKDYEQV